MEDSSNSEYRSIIDLMLHREMSVKEFSEQLAESGFMAQNFGKAREVIAEMKRQNATVFLSFTSNMAASGLRGVFMMLVKEKKVDVIVTSSGTIDEDLIRSRKPYLQGSFNADDAELGRKGINRMGNIYVPNDRYEFLEDISMELLESVFKNRKELTPSELLHEIGLLLENKESILYWAARNEIPIFCPGITDGAFGMQLMFFQQKHPDFRIDVVKDFKKIIDCAILAEKSGAIILGGGIAKHHAIIANLEREGFDYAVYINSSSPYHGSLSGATTEEAKSWGKIKDDAKSVTVFGDCAFIFPLLIASIDEMLPEKNKNFKKK